MSNCAGLTAISFNWLKLLTRRSGLVKKSGSENDENENDLLIMTPYPWVVYFHTHITISIKGVPALCLGMFTLLHTSA